MKQLESYLTDIGNRENMSMNAIVESRASVKATEILSDTEPKEILFPIGSGLLTKVGDEKAFFVNIGAGVTIEKNEEEVKEFESFEQHHGRPLRMLSKLEKLPTTLLI